MFRFVDKTALLSELRGLLVVPRQDCKRDAHMMKIMSLG